MGQRGPKPLSAKHLTLRGSRLARKRKQAEANETKWGNPPAGVLDSPESLGENGRKLWEAYAQDLVDDGLLVPDTLVSFGILCDAYDSYWQAQELVAKQGLLIAGSRGQMKKNPAVQIREKSLAQFISLAGRFGIVPA